MFLFASFLEDVLYELPDIGYVDNFMNNLSVVSSSNLAILQSSADNPTNCQFRHLLWSLSVADSTVFPFMVIKRAVLHRTFDFVATCVYVWK